MPRLLGRFGPPPSVVGGRIKAERERIGLTQEECARLLQIHRSSYKVLETVANPQLSTLIGLVTALGMDLRRIAPELFVAVDRDQLAG